MKSIINDYIKKKILKKNHSQNINLLNKKNIFVFPNFKGFQIGFLVFFCFTSSVFYQINFGLLLSIIIFIIFFISIVISFQNLNKITIDSFDHFIPANENTKIHLSLKNYSQNNKLNINLTTNKSDFVNIKKLKKSLNTDLKHIFPKRGIYELPTISIFSEFPFGIVRSSSYLKLNNKIIVYPQPLVPSTKILNYHNLDNIDNSSYEFDNIGDYEKGESLSKIAWKQSISKDKLLSKKFINENVISNILIDIDKINENLFENKLSYAAYLVLKFYKKKTPFSLKHKKFSLPFSFSLENRNNALTYLSNVKN